MTCRKPESAASEYSKGNPAPPNDAVAAFFTLFGSIAGCRRMSSRSLIACIAIIAAVSGTSVPASLGFLAKASRSMSDLPAIKYEDCQNHQSCCIRNSIRTVLRQEQCLILYDDIRL